MTGAIKVACGKSSGRLDRRPKQRSLHAGWGRFRRGVSVRVREMASEDEYRKRANECIVAADKAAEPERRVSLLELAQRWMRLAFQLDKIRDRKGSRGDALLDPPGTDQRTD